MMTSRGITTAGYDLPGMSRNPSIMMIWHEWRTEVAGVELTDAGSSGRTGTQRARGPVAEGGSARIRASERASS